MPHELSDFGLPSRLLLRFWLVRRGAGQTIYRETYERTTSPGFPCRVSLRDADVGETLLLLNYEHLPVASPYRSSHAIYVREYADGGAGCRSTRFPRCSAGGLSLRAFDKNGMMLEADVADGRDVQSLIERMLEKQAVEYPACAQRQAGLFCGSGR